MSIIREAEGQADNRQRTLTHMEISAANLTALFTGFDVIFQRGFEKPPSHYDKIATVVRSTSRQTSYPWLGRTTKFREWLGDRVVQALEAHAYTIVNKNFEDTISIDRNDLLSPA